MILFLSFQLINFKSQFHFPWEVRAVWLIDGVKNVITIFHKLFLHHGVIDFLCLLKFKAHSAASSSRLPSVSNTPVAKVNFGGNLYADGLFVWFLSAFSFSGMHTF